MLIQSAALWQLALHQHHLCLRRNGPARRENVILPLSYDFFVATWLPLFRNMEVVIFFLDFYGIQLFFFPPSPKPVICQGFSQKVVHVWKPAECNQSSPVDGSLKLRIGAMFSFCCNKITSNFYFFNKNVLEVKQKKNLIIDTPGGRFPNSFWIYFTYPCGKEPIEHFLKGEAHCKKEQNKIIIINEMNE